MTPAYTSINEWKWYKTKRKAIFACASLIGLILFGGVMTTASPFLIHHSNTRRLTEGIKFGLVCCITRQSHP